ncbi:c-type cytochrome [Bradyrhizobium sp. BWA-3-5]|uniref:c-type cytochrome n=1 Tax=Bradyrhizobium sp. BWA-3-5 TaxID=3080013 RepID=UPI00293F46E9|nr:c-type cytochrome [Bradyrhizobium sp. BWA-3-5]WOH68504.1 c-type cytochrome [Bradyrhizobium sp. BWA-3-5]
MVQGANALPAKRGRFALLTAVALIVLPIGVTAAFAQLRGHGGPVRGLAISADGQSAISGSFDSTAIRWSLTRNAAEQVLRFHSDAVNAVVLLADGRAATAGADGRIAIWTFGRTEPDAVLEGHTAPIVALAASPDGTALASASWDRTVRLWPLAGGAPRVLDGHTQNVNGVAFTADSHALISVSYDLSVRIWPLSGAETPTVVPMPTPLNAVAVGPDGEIAVGGADGKVYFLTDAGARTGEVAAGPRPVISIAISPDGAQVAAASIGGAVGVIDRKARNLARTLVGPGLPVWSMVFMPDSRTLLTGGADNIIRRWNAATGEPIDPILLETAGDPLAAYAGDRGAEIFRACVACHTLAADQGNRAGPTLAGIFGRRIATAPGYNFSEALKHLDIVWTPETISKLFEVGPQAYTPGTKMPEQRIGSEQDRAALVQFLERATRR